MGVGRSKSGSRPKREPRKLIGLPCWYNKECYVTRRSPSCECPTRLDEEAMFLANNGKWFRGKCAENGLDPADALHCFMRGPAWCRVNCREPCCMYCVTPERAEQMVQERSRRAPGPRKQPPPPCWLKGCRLRRRRADCVCPDRLRVEARAAKYDYRHVCRGPCRVFCDLRGPEWCRANCENPRCLYHDRVTGASPPCYGRKPDGCAGPARLFGDPKCHWCAPCEDTELSSALRYLDYEMDGSCRRQAKKARACEKLARLKSMAEDRRTATAEHCKRAAEGKRMRDVAEGFKRAASTGKCQKAARENPEKPAVAAVEKSSEKKATEADGKTAAATDDKTVAAVASATNDQTTAVGRKEFFDAAVELIAAARVRILQLECSNIPNESKRELRSCYKRVEAKSLKILENVNCKEYEPELKHLDRQRTRFEAICKNHDGQTEKFKKQPQTTFSFLKRVTHRLGSNAQQPQG